MTKSILQFPTKTDKHQPFRKAFRDAFCDDADDPQFNIRVTQKWIEHASVGIHALISFRSALHRWQACGHIPDAEFHDELARLSQAGFGDWFDELMAIALVVSITDALATSEVCNGR